jgi:peptide/nickel transport system permease protein
LRVDGRWEGTAIAQYALRRVVAIVPMLVVISIVVFTIIQITPGDPARIYIGEQSRASPEYLEQVRKDLGLDQPLYVQYLRWLQRTLRGDFGTSTITRQPVGQLLIDAAPKTLYLSAVTLLVAMAVGIPCGVMSAVRRNSRLDLVLTLLATFGVAMPSFWLAVLLILLFAVQLGWLPAFGFANPLEDPLGSLKLMILPALTLGLSMCAAIMRQLRSSMLNVLSAEYMKTARAKGLGELVVIRRHAIRNALIPVVTIIGVQATVLISGTVITETIFTIPGLGRLAVEAITAKDYPVLMGTMLVVTVGVLVVNLLVDLSYGLLDPRIRYS